MGFFNEDCTQLLTEKFSSESEKFLKLSFEAYENAHKLNTSLINSKIKAKVESELKTTAIEQIEENINNNKNNDTTCISSAIIASISSNSTSSSSYSSNENRNNQQKKNEEEKEEDIDEEASKEQWLFHYMFGKIKEKFHANVIECIQHYFTVNHFLSFIILIKCLF